MNIERALTVQGWMEEHDLLWLAEHAAKYKSIVEVGCWKGRSTIALAENTSGFVFAIDTWIGSVEHNPPVAGLYEEFLENVKHLTNIIPIRMPSVEAAAAWRYALPEMVFIDASHDYESVSADIKAWKPLVSRGGLLCGHDAGHEPIMKATQELLPGRRHEGSMWVVDL